MHTAIKGRKAAATAPAENAIAKKVLEEIEKIDAEAKQKKMAQLESLEQAKANIVDRISQLQHQLEQIEKAVHVITGGTAVPARKSDRKARRDLEEVRGRMSRWMESRKGERFMARDLVREFPELDGVQVSIFMKPLLDVGKVKTDTTEGIRRMKYFTE